MDGGKQNLNPMGKKLMKLLDLGEQTSFLDHVYLGRTQRECKSNESILEQYKKMFESRISTGATEQLLGWEKSDAKTVAWSYDMEGHAKKCVERFSELENRKPAQLYEVLTPCLNDHSVNKGRTGNRVQIVMTCLCLARIGRPDIAWSAKTGTSCHKMDHSLCETLGSFDFLRSSHE